MSTSTTALPQLTQDPASWTNASLLSVTQITPLGLQQLFKVATAMQQGDYSPTLLTNKILATIFFEASTRTACSFQASMLRLGGTYMHVDGKTSSAGAKGESVSDTVKCLQCYVDIVVLRHGTTGSVAQVIKDNNNNNDNSGNSKIVPVVNAGDGIGEHPTQALLDFFTIYNELKLEQDTKDELVVVMLGDLKHGRTVHSLAKLLASCAHIWTKKLVLRYCAVESLQMPDYVIDYVESKAAGEIEIVQEKYTDPAKACENIANVLYVTRIQRERFETKEEYEAVKGSYIINAEFMKSAPEKMIVMHPLPRVDEISTDIDSDPRAAYFRQMENGMYVRMALLALIFGKI